MKRNREDGLPRRHAEPDPPLTKPNETVDRDPKSVPAEPQNVEPRPAERPDLDWAEHED